jgi:transposase InsO family protein/transposase-like protein
MRAVKLYIEYDFSRADTVRNLGYPTPKMLARWYKEYLEEGDLHARYIKKPKYAEEQKIKAVTYYLEHGRNITRTIRHVGYPTRETLRLWIDELAPGERKVFSKRQNLIKFSCTQKEAAVVECSTRECAAADVAESIGVSRETLYVWRRKLIGEEYSKDMKRGKQSPLPDDKDALLLEIEALKKQIYHKQMELDVLTKAAELVKKGRGIDPKEMTNKEKTTLIDALRKTYPLNDLLVVVYLSKSSYFYQKNAMRRPDKYAKLRIEVRDIFTTAKRRYGYRRIHQQLRSRVSEKVVRRIMAEDSLVAKGRKRRKFSSYVGEISPAVENVISRNFHADSPNKKWLTDITEFHIPAGKVYLSPIIDCFDGMIVSYTIGTSPSAELVNTMLDDAIEELNKHEFPVIHSDRGSHYRWPGWLERMGGRNLTRSMSRKGCFQDNAACEGFFGRIKNEMFYEEDWRGVSIDQFMVWLNEYLIWYNEKRIKTSLGGMSPVDYRRNIGLVA